MLVFAVWLICVLVIIGLSAWLDQKYAITLNALKADIIAPDNNNVAAIPLTIYTNVSVIVISFISIPLYAPIRCL